MVISSEIHSEMLILYIHTCSGSVVVTACDSEPGRPGSNPEWRLIHYKA